MNADSTNDLCFAAWRPLREFVVNFRNENVGFEYQVDGLLNEIETLYGFLKAEARKSEALLRQIQSRLEEVGQENDRLKQENRQLRNVIDGSPHPVAE